MNNTVMDNEHSRKTSSSATGEIDVLKLIASRVNSQWKRNTDFVTENEQQPKIQRKDHDFSITQQDNGEDLKVKTVQRKDDHNSSCSHNVNKTEQELQSELEKVRQKCEKLGRENRELRGRLMEIDNNFSDETEITKLEVEKEKYQKEIKGLNKLIERHGQLHNNLRINFGKELKGKQEVIEDLRRQLVEMRDLPQKAAKERSALENENLQLKSEITEMKGKFNLIQDQFEDELKKKNSETDLKAKAAEINSLNEKLNEVTINYDQKLKQAANEISQLQKHILRRSVALKYCKHENKEMAKKLGELECNLKEKQEEFELLVSENDKVKKFAEKLKKITRFPDNENFPLINQLKELTDHIKDNLRLMNWYIANFDANNSGTGTSNLLLRQHN